jgi:hypothetical protein
MHKNIDQKDTQKGKQSHSSSCAALTSRVKLRRREVPNLGVHAVLMPQAPRGNAVAAAEPEEEARGEGGGGGAAAARHRL